MGKIIVGFFDPVGANLHSAVIDSMRNIRSGDLIVYHPNTHLVEVWRVRPDSKQKIFSHHCHLVSSQQFFLNMALQMAEIAKISGITTPVNPALEPYWSYQFV